MPFLAYISTFMLRWTVASDAILVYSCAVPWRYFPVARVGQMKRGQEISRANSSPQLSKQRLVSPDRRHLFRRKLEADFLLFVEYEKRGEGTAGLRNKIRQQIGAPVFHQFLELFSVDRLLQN